ncbi:ATP-dependent RNA helicase DRS1-like [Tropilaelaps mercedesae]|uniref:RNA helicase n=1 Tax=Tropilaelaps mercedesae TaxID=418985 RepID=A0A1V9XHB7_9ACAR|nr:ATP-dependent RNA helicase DRS1-like [Tropilaelaps mercedesae]
MADEDEVSVPVSEDNNIQTFNELKLSGWLLDRLRMIGIQKPSPVQRNCLPPILAGRDCIACAKTGSGKTLAFALPLLEALYKEPFGIFALILSPTRELAVQILEQFRILGKKVNLKDCLVVGGSDIVDQGRELAQRPHIVVATPGRLADHLQFTLDEIKPLLSKMRMVVLDEADQLLSGKYNDQLKTIFSALPKKRQTLLFSATLTRTIQEVQVLAMTDPFFYMAPSLVATVEGLLQKIILTPDHAKDSYLIQLVKRFQETNGKGLIIIFVGTRKKCQALSIGMDSLGFRNVALHAQRSQRERIAALAAFKSNAARILVATDVAARGLDIPRVELIINHNVPSEPKLYVHRVGRTARAGAGGISVTMATPQDLHLVHEIEKHVGVKMCKHKVDDNEVVKIMTQVNVAIREAEIRMDETDFEERQLIYKRKRLLLKNQELLGKPRRADEKQPNRKENAKKAKRKGKPLNEKMPKTKLKTAAVS